MPPDHSRPSVSASRLSVRASIPTGRASRHSEWATDPQVGPPDQCWPSGRASRPLPALREGLPTTHCPQGGSSDHFRPTGRDPDPSGRTSRPLPALREDFSTTPCSLVWTPDHSWSSGRVSRPLPVGPTDPTSAPPDPSGGPPNHSRPSVRSYRPYRCASRPFERAPDRSQPSARAFQPLPALLEGLPTLREVSLSSGRASQPFLEDFPTTPCPAKGPSNHFRPFARTS